MNFRLDSNHVLLLLSLNLFLGPTVLSSALCSQTNHIYIQIFWHIMPCRLVNYFSRYLEGTLCFRLQNQAAAGDLNLLQQLSEDLKFHIMPYCLLNVTCQILHFCEREVRHIDTVF